MSKRFFPLASPALVLLLPAFVAAAEQTGEVPATEHQMDVLDQVPETATTSPQTGGQTAEGAPVSPHQGQVLKGLEEGFAFFDIDRDGRISPSEAAADPELEAQWKGLDSNQDGQLDGAEFEEFGPGQSGEAK